MSNIYFRFTQFGIHPKMKSPGGYIGYAYSREALDVLILFNLWIYK